VNRIISPQNYARGKSKGVINMYLVGQPSVVLQYIVILRAERDRDALRNRHRVCQILVW
jgi:hypothetical protein